MPRIHKDIIISGADKEIKLWNLEGECIKTLEGHSSYVRALAATRIPLSAALKTRGSNCGIRGDA